MMFIKGEIIHVLGQRVYGNLCTLLSVLRKAKTVSKLVLKCKLLPRGKELIEADFILIPGESRNVSSQNGIMI